MEVTLADVIRTLRKHGENEMADLLNQGKLTIPFVVDKDKYTFVVDKDECTNADGTLNNSFGVDEDEFNEVAEWPITSIQTDGGPVDNIDGFDMTLKVPVIDE